MKYASDLKLPCQQIDLWTDGPIGCPIQFVISLGSNWRPKPWKLEYLQ